MKRGDSCSRIAIGFAANAPLSLAEGADLPLTGTQDADSLFLAHPRTLRQLRNRAAECYLPAGRMLLSAMDEGFSCSLAIPGLLLSLLAQHEPEVFDTIRDLAHHPRCELLGRTHFQSVAGIFRDCTEFREQVHLHQKTMQDLLGSHAAIYLATSFFSSPDLIETLTSLGFSGVYLRGYERVLNGCSTNVLLMYRGTPVLLQNCRLTDDIVIRGGRVEWDQYPLTAEKFARWVPLCQGQCIHIIADLEVLRHTNGRETRLFEFFRRLPGELAGQEVNTVLPSDTLTDPPAGELPLSYFPPGTDTEINSYNWFRTIMQHSALEAVERAGPWIHDRTLWRCFQGIDHFYQMATRSGECGQALHQATHQDAYDYFSWYMTALSRCEEAGIPRIRARTAARALRTVPPEKAFHFHDAFRHTGISAHSLDEFLEMIQYVSPDVIAFHTGRKDFVLWIRDVIQDPVLARDVKQCKDRKELLHVVEARVNRLWRSLR